MISPADRRARLAAIVDDNARELYSEFGPDTPSIGRLRDALRALLGVSDTFAARATGSRIVEGHGGLRPEHVCLLPAPVIIDSLEFSRDLHIADAVDEVGSLALECERPGAPTALACRYLELARAHCAGAEALASNPCVTPTHVEPSAGA